MLAAGPIRRAKLQSNRHHRPPTNHSPFLYRPDSSDVNKDWTGKDKDKDQAYKDQDKD